MPFNMPEMPLTPEQQREKENREKEQAELSNMDAARVAAWRKSLIEHNQLVDDWRYEEHDKKDEKPGDDFLTLTAEGVDKIVKDGMYTRVDPVTKEDYRSVIFRDGTFRPADRSGFHTDTFDKEGWNETLRFAKGKLGKDTLTFDFEQEIGPSLKLFGLELNFTRRAALKELEGIIALAQEDPINVEIKLGKNARKLVREISEDPEYKDKYKDKNGDTIRYEKYIDQKLEATRDKRDYSNTLMGLRDEKLEGHTNNLKNEKTPLPTTDADKETHKTNYINNEVYSSVGKDGVRAQVGRTDSLADLKARAEAQDKAIKSVGGDVKATEEVVKRLDQIVTQQGEMIENLNDAASLDNFKTKTKKSAASRVQRLDALGKVETNNEHNRLRINALEKTLQADKTAIEALPITAAFTQEDKKALVDKNAASLKELSDMKDKLAQQEAKISRPDPTDATKKVGIKPWDLDGRRKEAVAARAAKIEKDAKKPNDTTTVRISV